jgi:ABC-type sugar transport system ATPase subunit
MKVLVNIDSLNHRYDKRTTDGIQNIDLVINKGEILSLIGPSGSGKSTTLKCIADLIEQESGTISFTEEVITSYVDQYPDLNEEISVYENLNSVLSEIESEEKKSNQIRTTLTQLEITNEMNSLVKTISGGQKQRVIIAKALVKNPSLLLLDEPFANLDKTLRITLLEDLFEVFRERAITVIWVTHNTEEALNYSDRVALLNFGNLQQIGVPEQIYFKPQNMFVAQFFGHTNIIASKVIKESESELIVSLLKKEIVVPRPVNFKLQEHKDTLLVIHPNSIILDDSSEFKGTVEEILFRGSTKLIEIGYKENLFWCEINSNKKIKKSQKINFSFLTHSIHCLDEI